MTKGIDGKIVYSDGREEVIAFGTTWIPEEKYRNNKNIVSVALPGSIDFWEEYSFAGCSSLKSVKLFEGIKDIPWNAFENCVSLEEIDLPESLNVIDECAFYGCSSLKEIYLPESLTRIRDNAFANCKALKEIYIPENVMIIGVGVFVGCEALERIAVDPANPVYYDEGDCVIKREETMLVAGCKNSVIPNVKIIYKSAFCGCDNLRSVRLPDGLEIIGAWAFRNCKDLTEVYIPSSVKKIEMFAFSDCPNLTLFYSGTMEQWKQIAFSVGAKMELV